MRVGRIGEEGKTEIREKKKNHIQLWVLNMESIKKK